MKIIDRKVFEAWRDSLDDWGKMQLRLQEGAQLQYTIIPERGDVPERKAYVGIIDTFDILVVEIDEMVKARKALWRQIRMSLFGQKDNDELTEIDDDVIDSSMNDAVNSIAFWLAESYVVQSLEDVDILIGGFGHGKFFYEGEPQLEQLGCVTWHWLGQIAISLPEGTRCVWQDFTGVSELTYPNQNVPSEYHLPNGTIIHTRWDAGRFVLYDGPNLAGRQRMLAEQERIQYPDPVVQIPPSRLGGEQQ